MADPNAQFNTTSQALNPQFDPQALARLLMQAQTGQALMAQGMGDSPQGQMVSGHYVAPSPFQQLGKLASLLAGQKMATEGNAGVMQTNLANTRAMMGMNQDGTPTQGQGGQAGGNDPYGMPNLVRGMVINAVGGPEASKAYWANATPTNEMKNWTAQGIDPRQLAEYTRMTAAKNGWIEQNGMYLDPRTMQPVAIIPKLDNGVAPVMGTVNGITAPVGSYGIPGNAGAVGQIKGAEASAEQGAKAPYDFVTVPVQNKDGTWTNQLMSKAQAQQYVGGNGQATAQPPALNPSVPAPLANNNPGAMMPGGKLAQYPNMQAGLQAIDQNLASYGKQGVTTLAGVINKWAPAAGGNNTKAYIQDVAQRLHLDPNQKIDLSNPAVRQAIGTGIMLHENGPDAVFGKPPGVPSPSQPQISAQTEQATNTQKSWATLQEANRQAQTTTSYLQNIADLANKAIVGPASSKLNFANGLLSLLPGTQRATDAQTAADLLNKYSAQITARLGSGGMGTDAARTILQAAYPGAHMNQAAITEAVHNLVGANEMIKAKTSLLAPYGNARDSVGYQQREMIFDQNADPRIWQYKALRQSNPAAAKSFLQGVLKQDPHFIDKADALSKIGVQ